MGTFVYAHNDGMDRRALWTDLDYIKLSVGHFPWLLAGDFDVVLSSLEKSGREPLSVYKKVFAECLCSVKVLVHSFLGPIFTWSNRRDEQAFVAKNLDRVLANLA